MASRGINLLLASGKKLAKAGHRLVLLQPQEIVASVLRTARVDIVMPIAHDMHEALALLHGLQASSSAAPAGQAAAAAATPPPELRGRPTAPSVVHGELKLTIKNELAELGDLNARLAQFLEAHHVPHKATYAVNLAIDELVVNVIRYAYVDDDTHWIDIQLVVEGDQVILRITDDGRPFDPRRGPALDLHAEEREVGGLGLILVLDMVDVLKYRRAQDKNWVEVRVHLMTQDENDGNSAPERAASLA